MEGISKIPYEGQLILEINFSAAKRSKEATQQLVQGMVDEFIKYPLHSVLAIIDLSQSYFHIDTLKAFQKFQEKFGPYAKKVAVVGLKGLMKTGFKTVTESSKEEVKAFDSVEQARAWLISN